MGSLPRKNTTFCSLTIKDTRDIEGLMHGVRPWFLMQNVWTCDTIISDSEYHFVATPTKKGMDH